MVATKKKWRFFLCIWLENFGKSYFRKGQAYSKKFLTEIWAVIIFLNLKIFIIIIFTRFRKIMTTQISVRNFLE